MAKKWTNRNMAGALHFVTGNVLDRKQIFKHEKYCRAFLEEVHARRENRDCKVIAFVVMPDHIHLIVNPREGDIQASMGILKSLSAKKIIELSPDHTFRKSDGDNQVWQESFKALPLWSGWMINQKINYIHANPVKANLCATAEDYPWTSFRSFYRTEINPIMAIDKDWWWEGDGERLLELGRIYEEERRVELMKKIAQNKEKHRF
jgi:putative transposase